MNTGSRPTAVPGYDNNEWVIHDPGSDELAEEFDEAMELAHAGRHQESMRRLVEILNKHPWHIDAVMVIRKHKNVFADMSGHGFRRWRFYEGLATAIEYDVGHKIFFGSDYPFAKVDDSVQHLYDASRMARQAGLPLIPEAFIEDMLQRDSLQVLGMN